MNSWKLNSHASHYFKQAVTKGLFINYSDIYKTIKDIDENGVIETKDGKKYQLELKEIIKQK
jgi:hypothetical protein